ncbi:hypothetical protein C8R43DRAFT_955552 [Mycena crocata]|nr:hypothetical protein C8R43DRAFT_955552 [Mycena crocata]
MSNFAGGDRISSQFGRSDGAHEQGRRRTKIILAEPWHQQVQQKDSLAEEDPEEDARDVLRSCSNGNRPIHIMGTVRGHVRFNYYIDSMRWEWVYRGQAMVEVDFESNSGEGYLVGWEKPEYILRNCRPTGFCGTLDRATSKKRDLRTGIESYGQPTFKNTHEIREAAPNRICGPLETRSYAPPTVLILTYTYAIQYVEVGRVLCMRFISPTWTYYFKARKNGLTAGLWRP